MKKESMAKKMNHDVSKHYDTKKGGSVWRDKLQKGHESLNIPFKKDKGAKMNNLVAEGKNENNKA